MTARVDVADVLLKWLMTWKVVRRRGVAHRSGNIDRRRTGVDRLLDHLGQKVELGAGCIFRRKLHGRRQNPWPVFTESIARWMIRVIHLQLEHCRWIELVQERVQAAVFVLKGLAGRSISSVAAARPARRFSSAIAETAGDRLHRLEIAGDAIGNPASITSTPSSPGLRPLRPFSAVFMLHRAIARPPRSVVSKMMTRSECLGKLRWESNDSEFDVMSSEWPNVESHKNNNPETPRSQVEVFPSNESVRYLRPSERGAKQQVQDSR